MGSLIFLLQLAKKHIIHNGMQSLFTVLTIAISGSLLFFFRGYGLNVLDIVRESTVWDKGSHLDIFGNNVILVMSTLVIIITVSLYLLLQYIMIKSIARRQREIELFTILGASSREIISGFLCEVCLIVMAGLILGGGLALWSGSIYHDVIVLLSQLFEFNYLDPVDTSSPLLLVLSVSIEIISISILAALIAVKRGVRKSRLIVLNCERG
ncbi:FtsX-like permease family protein [Photobacterium sagamiensis]|uniref:FtsX-like permease family protein n=1 Tax=Photobacterium sagamiensis TaxID=2910241 RepID=UPI003D1392DC